MIDKINKQNNNKLKNNVEIPSENSEENFLVRGKLNLKEASKLTPYSDEYLGLLIRKKRLEGFKEKGKWYTNKEAVESYMQKVAEASYAHQENLNVEVPAEKIKLASLNLKWALFLTGVIFVGAVLFGAYAYVKAQQDSACLRYKVTKDENGNISIQVGKDEYVRNVLVVQGE